MKISKPMLALIGLILVTAVVANGGLLSLASSDIVVAPNFARLECSPTDSYEGQRFYTAPISPPFPLDNKGISVVCGDDAVTDSCKIHANGDDRSWYQGTIELVYNVCNKEGGSCSSNRREMLPRDGSELFITEITADQSLWMRTREGEATIRKEYRVWQLYRFIDGGKFIAKSQDCCLTSTIKKNVLDIEFNKLRQINPDECLKTFGGIGEKWINYVDSWNVKYVGNNIISYQGQKAYCQAPFVYSLTEIKTASGDSYFLEPNYEKSLQDSVVLRAGEPLATNIECCPYESNCGGDFKWDTISPTQCSSSLDCENAGLPIPVSKTSYALSQCVEGTCKDTIKTAECTNNIACLEKYGADSGLICDLSQGNYGNCILQSDSIPCEVTETCLPEYDPTDEKSPFGWRHALTALAGLLTFILLRPSSGKDYVGWGIAIAGVGIGGWIAWMFFGDWVMMTFLAIAIIALGIIKGVVLR